MADATPPSLIIPTLIVGLGNPGKQYEQTRHNVGFMALDRLADHWHIPLSEHRKFQGRFGEGRVGNRKVYLLQPLTYMNQSGQAIRAVVDWYKLAPESVLVIYDEMDLPAGRLRLRLSGSAGGQNGMKSTIAHLGTQNFPRLRIGIGSPKSLPQGGTGVSHVLGSFAPIERPLIDQVLDWTVSAIAMSLQQGVEKTMSLYNNRTVAQPTG